MSDDDLDNISLVAGAGFIPPPVTKSLTGSRGGLYLDVCCNPPRRGQGPHGGAFASRRRSGVPGRLVAGGSAFFATGRRFRGSSRVAQGGLHNLADGVVALYPRKAVGSFARGEACSRVAGRRYGGGAYGIHEEPEASKMRRNLS
jgi:hypothetical protein